MRHLFGFFYACIVAVLSLPSAIGTMVSRFVDHLLELWSDGGSLYLRTDFATGQLVPTLAGIDPALYQANRHEAGTARRAAERHV